MFAIDRCHIDKFLAVGAKVSSFMKPMGAFPAVMAVISILFKMSTAMRACIPLLHN